MIIYDPSKGDIFESNSEFNKTKLKEITDSVNEKLKNDNTITWKEILNEIYRELGISNDIDKWEAD